jgi:putative heme-binding domain-containing protein
MFTAHWHQEDPGVMPAGDNSGSGAPTGVALNEGDALGPAYQGMLFSADAGRNLVFGYKPISKGAGFELKGRRTNFLSSLSADNKGYVWNDQKANEDSKKWFRPSDVMVGTDGALYVADWYDPVVGGHQMQDAKGYGRIYRVTPKGKVLKTPRLDLSTPEGQLDVLKNPAVNVRNSGYEALKSRGKEALPLVRSLLTSSNPYHQARGIWLMASLGKEGAVEVEQYVFSTNNRLSVAAVRALRNVYSSASFLSLIGRIHHPSPAMQREIAIVLRDFPLEQKKDVLKSLLSLYDGKDAYLTEALGAAFEKESELLFPFIDSLFNLPSVKKKGVWNSGYAKLLWRLHPQSALPQLAQWAADANTPLIERKNMLTAIAFIQTPEAVNAMLKLTKSPLKDVRETALYWVAFRKGNDWADLSDWKDKGLDWSLERRKAEMKAAREKILNEYIAFNDRKNTALRMAKDPFGGQLVLDLLKEKKFPQDLIAIVKPELLKHPDLGVKTQALQLFTDKEASLYDLKQLLKIEPDIRKGQLVFQKNCSGCHKVGSQGATIGPDLTGIGHKLDRSSLMDAILRPSAAIVFGYEVWSVATKEGDSFYGFILSEDSKIVMKDLAGQQHIIAKSSIISKKKQLGSLMPAPASMGLSKEDIADITAFLMQATK